MTLPRAISVGSGLAPEARVTLDYAGRLIRRKRLTTDGGLDFLVDLPRATHVEPGQAFLLDTGEAVGIHAALEDLLQITGDVPRLAWHIGNRHTPCEFDRDTLFIQADAVLEKMLRGLGADVAQVKRPFQPEGGAYGHGRTMGHAHEH